MKRAARASADDGADEAAFPKRLKEQFEREDAEAAVRVNAYLARMPAALARMDADAAQLVVFQIRAELRRAGGGGGVGGEGVSGAPASVGEADAKAPEAHSEL